MKGMGQEIGTVFQAEGHGERKFLRCPQLNYSSLEEETRQMNQLTAADWTNKRLTFPNVCSTSGSYRERTTAYHPTTSYLYRNFPDCCPQPIDASNTFSWQAIHLCQNFTPFTFSCPLYIQQCKFFQNLHLSSQNSSYKSPINPRMEDMLVFSCCSFRLHAPGPGLFSG